MLTTNQYMYPIGQDRVREATPPYVAGVNFPLGASTIVWAVKGTAGLTNSFIPYLSNCPTSTGTIPLATFTGNWQIVKATVYMPNTQAGCNGVRLGSGAPTDSNTLPFKIAYMAIVPAMGDIAPASVATPTFTTVGGQPTFLPITAPVAPLAIMTPVGCLGGNDDPEIQYQCVARDAAGNTRAGAVGHFYKKITAGCTALVTCAPLGGAVTIDVYRPFGGSPGGSPDNNFQPWLLGTVSGVTGGTVTDPGPRALCSVGCTAQAPPADNATGLLYIKNRDLYT